jgi:hypothetical protein
MQHRHRRVTRVSRFKGAHSRFHATGLDSGITRRANHLPERISPEHAASLTSIWDFYIVALSVVSFLYVVLSILGTVAHVCFANEMSSCCCILNAMAPPRADLAQPQPLATFNPQGLAYAKRMVDGQPCPAPASIPSHSQIRLVPQRSRAFALSLERRGFAIEAGTVHECDSAVSARRREMSPVRNAA